MKKLCEKYEKLLMTPMDPVPASEAYLAVCHIDERIVDCKGKYKVCEVWKEYENKMSKLQ